MNRLSFALNALLFGVPAAPEPTVKEVEVPVVGKPYAVSLYEAATTTVELESYGAYPVRTTLGWYLTCEQAHGAHPGAAVMQHKAFKFGKQHYLIGAMTKVSVAKP